MAYQSYQTNDATLVVSVEGRLDSETAAQMTTHWTEDSRICNIVVDLSQATVLESPGLAALVSGQSLARDREGDLIIAAPSEAVKTILALTGLNRSIEVAPSVDNALTRFGAV